MQFEGAFWWVNHKQTFRQEVNGNYLWAPTTKANGARSVFYDNMKRVRLNDMVFSFSDTMIQAVGICTAPAILGPKPNEFGTAGANWHDIGWEVAVKFVRIEPPILVQKHIGALASTLPDKYSPIRANGHGNQGAYLAAIPPSMGSALLDIMKTQGVDFKQLLATIDDVSRGEFVEGNDKAEISVLNRTDIGDTDKQRLIKARRGQGIYRSNLEQFENACRVTGLHDKRHLRASHIKPWAASTDYERLDGNNGLLLSPHIDHLFDRGFVSFEDCGELLIGKHCSQELINTWHLDNRPSPSPFREEQLPYLIYHREFILQR